MCFSEEASFVSAAALTVISGACIYAARHTKNYIALAMIPLFFALQQASEGVEWLVFNQRLGTSHEAQLASDVFVLIAYVVWPFWIPFSLWIAEKTPTSRAYLRILFCIGCAVAVYNGWNVLTRPEKAYVRNKSIYYYVFVDQVLIWPYFCATIIPWFISSLPYFKWLGTFILFSAIVSAYFYYYTFTSVWCFFGAFVSLFLLFIIRHETKKSRTS